ncbi:MAG: hypothetical protein JAY64_02645, partial [Candidatus Thiodiazotropha weberae]|nr:hypothetical protein [Candidatus Thiodiazotropha lotti]MCW4210042.1 hypothetical protein [Candidatus Thiodiazotropha lotti]
MAGAARLSQQAGYGIKRPAESQTLQHPKSAEALGLFSRVENTHILKRTFELPFLAKALILSF